MENKIKSAEEILMHHAGELWVEDKIDLQTLYGVYSAMQEYAKMIVDAQLEVAAEEAICEDVSKSWEYFRDYQVDKESIINCTRISLD